MKLTSALIRIRLSAVNDAKVAALDALALDALAAEYIALCQHSVTHFCAEAEPNGYADPCFPVYSSSAGSVSPSSRQPGLPGHGEATTNARKRISLAPFASWLEEDHAPEEESPTEKPRQVPTLRKVVIQANDNVALLQPGQESSFPYWLRISTLEARQPIFLPVQLAAYHERCLAGKRLGSSVTLTRKPDGWWLTVTDEEDAPQTSPDAPVVGVGMAHAVSLN
jgi:hypothetical protein